jgi:hypothetical protein
MAVPIVLNRAGESSGLPRCSVRNVTTWLGLAFRRFASSDPTSTSHDHPSKADESSGGRHWNGDLETSAPFCMMSSAVTDAGVKPSPVVVGLETLE